MNLLQLWQAKLDGYFAASLTPHRQHGASRVTRGRIVYLPAYRGDRFSMKALTPSR